MTKFSQNPNDYSFSIDPVVIAEENVSTNGVRYIQLRTAIINGVKPIEIPI